MITTDTDPHKCQALASAGQWYNEHTWLVPGCTTIYHDGKSIRDCAGGYKRKITLIGDLHVQRLYFQVGRRLDRDIQIPNNRRQDLHLTKDNIELQFFYDPYLNGSGLIDTVASYHNGGTDRPLLTVVGAGNTYAEKAMAEDYALTIQSLASSAGTSKIGQDFTYDQGPGDLLLWTPADEPLRQDSSDNFHRIVNDRLADTVSANVLWSFRDMIAGRKDLYKDDGVRVQDEVIRRRVDVLLNLRCNAQVGRKGNFPNRAVCCGVWRGPNWVQMSFLLLGLAILPLVVLTDFKLGFLSDTSRPVLRAFCFFTVAVSLQWIADRTHIFDQGTRLDLVKSNLYFMIAAAFLFGFITIRRCKPLRTSSPGEIKSSLPCLPRDQTNEWKGWMQALIVIYHYNKAWKYDEFWQVIRLSVSSYLFLTGFGHTLYFLQKKDYSLQRFTNVMIRTNLLPVTLSYVMRTRWLLYYYMPLSTFNFVVVYLTLALGRRYNAYTAFLLGKIAASAFLVHIFLTTRDLPTTFVRLFRITCNLNFDSGEFFGHRVEQDRYIVFVGMLAAMVYIWIRAILGSSDRQDRLSRSFRAAWPVLKWSAIVLAAATHAGFWYWIRTHIRTQTQFRKIQPYVTGIPILTFIVLRNAHPILRNWHSAAFAWLGKYSGEMYVVQDHLWLADDQEAVLQTGLFHGNETLMGDRWRDLLLITPLYLIACSVIGDATGVIADWCTREEPVAGYQASINTNRPVDEVEMGLLVGDEATTEECMNLKNQVTDTPPWWTQTHDKISVLHIWPNKLKYRIWLILGIMWLLNMVRSKRTVYVSLW